MKTWNAKKGEIVPQWWIVDASEKKLGRMATELAKVLSGAHRPTYTPHVDTGDFIVVINAEKITLTGAKTEQKKYYRHSRFFGSLKEKSAKEMINDKPTEVVLKAVQGMLPKSKLGRQMLTKLKIFAGPDHQHQAQNPKSLEIR